MERGFSLSELVVSASIVTLITALAVPRAARFLDRIAVERAATEITTSLAVGRHAAVLRSARARVRITSESLHVDLRLESAWRPWRALPGPASHGVAIEISNPEITFAPSGIGWGASNTKIVLRRGSQSETITVSRLGRVKRW